MRGLSVTLAYLVLVPLAIFGGTSPGWAANTSAEAEGDFDLSIYAKSHRMVEVEPGRQLNLVCIGDGSPTVVFDIGVGDPAGDWSQVQPRVAKITRTCSYDRAGLGFSDEFAGDGSSAYIVADLRRLLKAASIEPRTSWSGNPTAA